MSVQPRTRRLTIIGQDPSVMRDGRIVRAEVEVLVRKFPEANSLLR
jgi:hypothetical protein